MQRQEAAQVSETSFQTIYRLAKEIVNMLNGQNRREKEKTLAAFLAAGHCVDVHQGLETPISRLASENNDAAVHLLHYTFGANIGNAIIGYAYGNHVEKVKRRLAITKGRLSYAVVGYAYAGNSTQAEMEAKKLDGDSSKDQYLLIGYACGGWDKIINDLIPARKGLAWHYAVWGYALGGRVEQVKKMFEQNPDVEQYGNHLRLIRGLIGGYALGGFVQQVNELRALRPVTNYAWDSYCTLDLDVLASFYYARGGHIKEVNQLLCCSSQLYKNRTYLMELLEIYTRMGCLTEVNKLCTLYKLYDVPAGDYWRVNFLYHGSFLNYCDDTFTSDSILRTLTLIQNPDLRKNVVNRMDQECLKSKKYNAWPAFPAFIDFNSLWKKANQLILLMSTYSVDYQRALTLKEYPELQGLINHFALSYDQAFSILKEPGLIGFFQYCYWLEQQQGIALSDIIALCTSFTAGLAHEDAKNLYRISIKTGFFSRSLAHQKQRPDDQPGQKGNKIKHTLSHVLNRFKKH